MLLPWLGPARIPCQPTMMQPSVLQCLGTLPVSELSVVLQGQERLHSLPKTSLGCPHPVRSASVSALKSWSVDDPALCYCGFCFCGVFCFILFCCDTGI